MLYERALADLRAHLDRAALVLDAGDPTTIGMDLQELFESLYLMKSHLPTYAWQNLVGPEVREHRIMGFLAQEPFTARALTKPRGYPGDAVMMDFLYHHRAVEAVISEATVVGKDIMSFILQCHMGGAVRARRAAIAKTVRTTLEEKPGAKILSLAAGHMREMELLGAEPQQAGARLLALDQDEESVAEINRCYSGLGIEARASGLKPFLGQHAVEQFGTFDLIYATGLYDYLPDKLGKALTKGMFDCLNPGGRVVIPNFMPDLPDAAYIESVCDWWLIYRDERDMLDLCEGISANQIEFLDVHTDNHNQIATVVVQKAA